MKCGHFGRPAKECGLCAMERRISRKVRYAARRAAGVCSSCGTARPRPGQGMCGQCRGRANEIQWTRMAVLRAAKQCIQCGGAPEPGRARCRTCAARPGRGKA